MWSHRLHLWSVAFSTLVSLAALTQRFISCSIPSKHTDLFGLLPGLLPRVSGLRRYPPHKPRDSAAEGKCVCQFNYNTTGCIQRIAPGTKSRRVSFKDDKKSRRQSRGRSCKKTSGIHDDDAGAQAQLHNRVICLSWIKLCFFFFWGELFLYLTTKRSPWVCSSEIVSPDC